MQRDWLDVTRIKLAVNFGLINFVEKLKDRRTYIFGDAIAAHDVA